MSSLVDFLRERSIPFREGGTHRHVRPGWVGIDCPHCGRGSGKFHAGIRDDLSRAVCWRCGSLPLWDLLADATDMEWYAVRQLITPSKGTQPLPTVRHGVRTPAGLGPLTAPYRRYLRDRGFDPGVIQDLWEVQATGPVGHLAWRLWIPIHLDDKLVSWTTRAIGDKEPRYISASPEQESVNLKTILYGENLAHHAVVVVEGPTDVWAIGPGAVAVLGLQVTPAQVERLGRHPLRAICFDREAAAMRRAERLGMLLDQYPGETHLIELETGSDPADADREEIDEIRYRFL